MNLSKGQLNVLMITLPRMRMSQIIRYTNKLPIETLLSIRSAGKQIKFAAEVDTELLGVSQWIDEVVKPKASEYINKSKSIVDSIIQKSSNAEEIKAAIQDEKYLKGENNTSKASEIESDMKELGLNSSDAQQISNYISLKRMLNGKYDSNFIDTISRFANKLKGVKPGLTLEEAKNDMVTYYSLGTLPEMETQNLTEERLEKSKKEGESLFKALDKMMSQGNIPGGGAFIKNMNLIGTAFFSNTRLKYKQQKEMETTKPDTEDKATADPSDVELETGWYPTENEEGEEEGGPIQLDNLKRIEELQKESRKYRKETMQILDDIIDEVVPEKGSPKERADKIRKISFIFKFAYGNPIYRANDPNKALPANSNTYYTRNEKKMQQAGIESLDEFKKLMSEAIFTKVQKKIDKALGWDQESGYKQLTKSMSKAASASLSHQLLKRAASIGKLNMIGMVCGIDQNSRTAGNVMVFERSRPRFAHVFNWKIEEGKILIANIDDVDKEHINEAYHTALEAVQQEVLINNMEEQLNK